MLYAPFSLTIPCRKSIVYRTLNGTISMRVVEQERPMGEYDRMPVCEVQDVPLTLDYRQE